MPPSHRVGSTGKSYEQGNRAIDLALDRNIERGAKRRPGGELASGGGEALGAIAALADALPDPALVLDAEARVLIANPRAREAFDHDPVGAHLSATIRAPAVLQAVRQVAAGAEPVQVDYEQRVPIERLFEAVIAPVRSKGAITGGAAVLVLLRDLTRQQQVERMRADFVANASHELRTPLASVIGFIETLQGAARDDTQARERFLTLMQAQADRMRRLVDDLLSLSRIEMNAHRRPTEKVELGAIARQACDLLANQAGEAGVSIKIDCPESVTIAGDRDELLQVMANLIENAIKYAAAGKSVDINVARAGGHASIAVTDHGPGIAPEHLPRLTERFYRVSVKDSRARGGTGLGLAIVKHILNRHRGKLKIDSEPGRGSTFAVLLPVEK